MDRFYYDGPGQSGSSSTLLYVLLGIAVLLMVLFLLQENSTYGNPFSSHHKQPLPKPAHTMTTRAPTTSTVVVTTTRTPTKVTTRKVTTVKPKYLTHGDHKGIHLREEIDRELRQLAEQIISPEASAVPSRVAPRPAVVANHKVTAAPAKHVRYKPARHPYGCTCNLCQVRKQTPAPICASMQLPLGRINFDNYDAWKGRPRMPWWKKPATRHPIDRPRYTAVPINWHMHPDHKKKTKACHH